MADGIEYGARQQLAQMDALIDPTGDRGGADFSKRSVLDMIGNPQLSGAVNLADTLLFNGRIAQATSIHSDFGALQRARNQALSAGVSTEVSEAFREMREAGILSEDMSHILEPVMRTSNMFAPAQVDTLFHVLGVDRMQEFSGWYSERASAAYARHAGIAAYMPGFNYSSVRETMRDFMASSREAGVSGSVALGYVNEMTSRGMDISDLWGAGDDRSREHLLSQVSEFESIANRTGQNVKQVLARYEKVLGNIGDELTQSIKRVESATEQAKLLYGTDRDTFLVEQLGAQRSFNAAGMAIDVAGTADIAYEASAFRREIGEMALAGTSFNMTPDQAAQSLMQSRAYTAGSLEGRGYAAILSLLPNAERREGESYSDYRERMASAASEKGLDTRIVDFIRSGSATPETLARLNSGQVGAGIDPTVFSGLLSSGAADEYAATASGALSSPEAILAEAQQNRVLRPAADYLSSHLPAGLAARRKWLHDLSSQLSSGTFTGEFADIDEDTTLQASLRTGLARNGLLANLLGSMYSEPTEQERQQVDAYTEAQEFFSGNLLNPEQRARRKQVLEISKGVVAAAELPKDKFHNLATTPVDDMTSGEKRVHTMLASLQGLVQEHGDWTLSDLDHENKYLGWVLRPIAQKLGLDDDATLQDVYDAYTGLFRGGTDSALDTLREIPNGELSIGMGARGQYAPNTLSIKKFLSSATVSKDSDKETDDAGKDSGKPSEDGDISDLVKSITQLVDALRDLLPLLGFHPTPAK